MGNGPTVFVWDLDETLIIFQTLLDGRYVELFDGFKDSHKATLLGRRWERLILEVCDDYFFYNQVSREADFFLKTLSAGHETYESLGIKQIYMYQTAFQDRLFQICKALQI